MCNQESLVEIDRCFIIEIFIRLEIIKEKDKNNYLFMFRNKRIHFY